MHLRRYAGWHAEQVVYLVRIVEVHVEGAPAGLAFVFVVYPEKGKPYSPKVPKASGYETEIRTFAAWVCGDKSAEPVSAKSARDSVSIVDAERKSARVGRTVRIDS